MVEIQPSGSVAVVKTQQEEEEEAAVVTATVTGARSHSPWDPKTLLRKAPRCLSLSHTHIHSRTSSTTHTLTPPLRELPVASIGCCHGNGMGRPFLQAMGFKPHSLGSSLYA